MSRHTTEHAVDRFEHAVQLYDDDLVLIGSMQQFLSAGLSAGDACVVIATPEHTAALLEALEASGLDMASLSAEGCFVTLDAGQTLKTFLVAGLVDPQLFTATFGAVLERAAGRGRRVRAVGELVALLWADGNVTAALEVESLWNALGSDYDTSLLCAYPVESFSDPAFAAPFRQMCAKHTQVVPAASEGSLTLPFELASGSQARAYLRERLPLMGCVHVLEDAVLLLSELVNNAVVHAGSGAEVRLRRSDDLLFVEVRDGGAGGVLRRDAQTHDLGGRGLALLDTVAAQWGADAAGAAGHRVWFQLDLSV